MKFDNTEWSSAIVDLQNLSLLIDEFPKIEKATSVERHWLKLQQVECLGGTTVEIRSAGMKSLQIL
jgi:hypothetical protein